MPINNLDDEQQENDKEEDYSDALGGSRRRSSRTNRNTNQHNDYIYYNDNDEDNLGLDDFIVYDNEEEQDRFEKQDINLPTKKRTNNNQITSSSQQDNNNSSKIKKRKTKILKETVNIIPTSRETRKNREESFKIAEEGKRKEEEALRKIVQNEAIVIQQETTSSDKNNQQIIAIENNNQPNEMIVKKKNDNEEERITVRDRFVGITNDNQQVLLDKSLAKILKNHQLEGIYFCFRNILQQQGCILAHSMGLGKTIQIVLFSFLSMNYLGIKKVIILCPKTVIINWESEYLKWLTIINTTIKTYKIDDKQNTINKRMEVLKNWEQQGGALILSFEMFKRLLGKYNRDKIYNKINNLKIKLQKNENKRTREQKKGNSVIASIERQIIEITENIKKEEQKIRDTEQFEAHATRMITNCDLIIVDEAHRMCSSNNTFLNQALAQIKTSCKICLTGTPFQNHLNEYYTMINWLKPGFWNKSEFDEIFTKPIHAGIRKDSTEEEIVWMKKRTFMLIDLTKHMIDRKDQLVLRETLPPKREYVIHFRVNRFQAQLYKAFAKARDVKNAKLYTTDKEEDEKHSKNLFYLAIMLQKIVNHPDLIKKYCEKRGITNLKDLEQLNKKNNNVFISKHESSTINEMKNNVQGGRGKKRSEKITNTKNNKHNNIDIDELLNIDAMTYFTTVNHNNIKEKEITTTTPLKEQLKEEQIIDEQVEEEETISPLPSTMTKTVKEHKKLMSSMDNEEDIEINIEDFDKEYEGACRESKDNYFWASPVLHTNYVEGLAKRSPKMEFLIRMIEKCYNLNEKILVFSQFTETLDVIEQVLKNTPIIIMGDENGKPTKRVLLKEDDYYRLDGKTKMSQRQELVDNFNTLNEVKLFLISTRAGGLGINLTSATRVVIFDCSWNGTWDIQSIFRTYRYGQTKPVFIYRLITYGTVEEKIYNIALAKTWLSKRLVDNKSPGLLLRKDDLQIFKQAENIESTMTDTLLINPKIYSDDIVLNELLGTQWILDDNSEIDNLRPVHVDLVDNRIEKQQQESGNTTTLSQTTLTDLINKATTFLNDVFEEGEFDVSKKVKSVYQFESLFIEDENLRLSENEKLTTCEEYEKIREEMKNGTYKWTNNRQRTELIDNINNTQLINSNSCDKQLLLVDPTSIPLNPSTPLKKNSQVFFSTTTTTNTTPNMIHSLTNNLSKFNITTPNQPVTNSESITMPTNRKNKKDEMLIVNEDYSLPILIEDNDDEK
ncbi:hypothetical protein ABK040_007753 [Willaertia magna]